MADSVRLLVNGRAYEGWKSVRITRSIESIAGSFELEVSDRWAEQREPWAIAEEDECQVAIGDHVLVHGFVDRRAISIAATQRTLTYSGRDRAGALVDCSAILSRWSFRNLDPAAFATELCQPFGIAVRVQPGLRLERIRKLVVHPGDSPFHALQRVTAAAGVLAVSDGAGGIELTRTGSSKAAALVLGQNIMAGSVDYDGADRFRRYVVIASVSGDDDADVERARIRAEALDLGVKRKDRVLMIRPEQGLSTERARIRGDWEARLRAARAETVSITVHGWTQPDGVPWPVNALCPVTAPALGVDGTLLISQVEYVLEAGGQLSLLRLVRPDAFAPEPQPVVRNPAKAADPEPAAVRAPRQWGFAQIVGFPRIVGNKWKNPTGGDDG